MSGFGVFGVKGAKKLTILAVQGKNLAAKDKSGTSDPVCNSSLGMAEMTGMTDMKLIDLFLVPGHFAGRYQRYDAVCAEDSQPRMEPPMRPTRH